MSTEPRSVIGNIVSILRKIGIKPIYLFIPMSLSLISAVFEGAGMSLLIPILNGFFQKSFAFIMDIPILGPLVSHLPEEVLNNDRMLFAVLLTGFVTIYIFKNIVRYLSTVSIVYFAQRSIHHLRKVLFTRYLSFGKMFFDTSSVGHHNALLIEFTRDALMPVTIFGQLINSMFSLVVYLVVMLMISWKLTLVALPLFLVLHLAVRFMISRIKTLSHYIAEGSADLGKRSIEVLSAIPLIKSYHTERLELDRYTAISHQKARYDFQLRALSAFILPMQEIITVLFAVSILVGSLWWFGRSEIASASAIIVYFYVVMNASSKLGSISTFRGNLAAASGPLEKVMTIFSEEDKFYVEDGSKSCTGLEKAIEISHLTFAYQNNRTILKDVSLTIPKGKMVAIVGATGSGKSTIISLLMRYYDCPPGKITLDGTDIREFTMKSYLSHIALVSQETLLFHDSLRNNIAYGLDHVTDADIQEAVTNARLADFVSNLPEGLNTLIGDRGVKLSGGEKQRVSIARALLKKAEILILDEATSSLDSQTEKLIQEAIDDAVDGRTAVVIAHRLSTIQHADQIIVLDNGVLVESGSLDELLAKKGKFHDLWTRQKF